MGLFLFFIQFFSFSSYALNAEVAQSKEWKALLQYQKNFLGMESSEVDGPQFFLSKEGKTDPEAELISTLEAFQQKIVLDEKGEDNQHPICKFPARYEYLKKFFDFKNFPEPKCASFRIYRERIQGRKVSIVFSSYYSGSASSVFGHSFLKFSGDNDNELFDTGINFSANPTTQNPALYSIYGLIGVFPASFSAQPFYYKVREYNDFESRDLWSYELNLSQKQIQNLIAHIWEMGDTYFEYYYFNENCSYQILRIMEGAIPEINFFHSRPVYLIPSDSIKLLDQVPNLVANVQYRPSIRNITESEYAKLSDDQKNELVKSLKDREYFSTDAQVLDAQMDAIDLNEAEKLVKKDPAITAWKEKVLQKRAQVDTMSPASRLVPPFNEQPHLGHGSSRLTLGLDHQSVSMKWKISLHDLLDPSIGYPRQLHIDFGRVGVRYMKEKQKLLFDELTLIDLTALSIHHSLYSKASYLIKIGFEQKEYPVVEIKGGIGKTFSFWGRHLIYGMLVLNPHYSSQFLNEKFILGAGPLIGMLFEWMPHFKSQMLFPSQYQWGATEHWNHQLSLENRYVFSNQIGLGLEMDLNTIAFKGMYYF